MKHLMYLSITILCLSVSALIGFHLGVSKAEADFEPGGIVIGASQGVFLTSDGLAWSAGAQGGFAREATMDVPAELVSQIKFWAASSFVTINDEVYVNAPNWLNIGTPGGTSGVPTNPTTWGQLKNKYQEESP